MDENHDIMIEILHRLKQFEPKGNPVSSLMMLIWLLTFLSRTHNYYNDNNVFATFFVHYTFLITACMGAP